jgi:hypothetical protein
MRCSAWSSLAISVCSALLLSPPASAHIVPDPAFVQTGATEGISLNVHNDRRLAMEGFVVTVPEGLRVVDVESPDGWEGSSSDATARWTGSAPPGQGTDFVVRLDVASAPGAIKLVASQFYPDGRTVDWPVGLTVVPGGEDASPTSWVWLVIGGAGLLVLAAVAVLAWRSRAQKRSAKNA